MYHHRLQSARPQIRWHAQQPRPDYIWECSQGRTILAPMIHIHIRNVMIASVTSAATPSPQVIATYSRRMIQVPEMY